MATARALRRTRKALREVGGGIEKKSGPSALELGTASALRSIGVPIPATKESAKTTRVLSSPYQVARATAEDPKAVGKATLKGAKDTVVNIPASAVKTVTDPKGAVEGIAKDYKRRYGPLIEGKPEKFRKRIKKEGATAEILDATAVGTGGSRLLAGTLKKTARGRRVMRDLPDQTAPGTTIRTRRRASKGAVGQSIRKYREQKRTKKAQEGYRKADEARARGVDESEVRALKREAAQKDPRRVPEKEIRRRYDEREDLAERRRRGHRSDVLKGTKKAQEGGKKKRKLARRKGKNSEREQSAGLLAAQGIGRSRESVRKYLDDIREEAKTLASPAKVAANKRLQTRLEAILKDDKIDFAKVRQAADDYAAVAGPLQAELVERRIVNAKQAQMAKLIPYAVREMGAKWNAGAKRLELDGRSLKAREIEAHMRQNGIDPAKIAFVSQAPGVKGPGAYYKSWQQPKGIGSAKRTGEATRKGTFDIDPEAGRANIASMQSLRDAHNEYAEFVKEFGYRGGGKTIKTFKTKREADQFIRDLAESPAEKGGKLTPATYEWRAVPVSPQFGKHAQGEALLDQVNDILDDGRSLSATEAVETALKGGDSKGRYVLVLDAAADQQMKHIRQLNPTAAGRVFRQGSRLFRGAVLTTSTSWPTGNIIEGLVRAGVRRAGPADARFARRVAQELEKMDPDMAAEFRHRVSQGHFGIEDVQAVHMTAEHFRDSAKLGKLAQLLGAMRRTPGPKQVADFWTTYTKIIFGSNGLIEHHVKQAMAGQAMKDLLLSERQITNWGKAIEEAARGLRNTNAQIEIARDVRRAYGKYEAFSPSQRFIISHFTPFAAWALNAAYFLTWVLPKDHPILTAVAAANARAWEEWRKDEALNLLPGFLQGASPTKGGLRRIGRYTPFALAGNPTETAGRLVLPQFSGAILATMGVDWKLKPLAGKENAFDVTEGERLAGVGAALAGSFVPGLNPIRKVMKDGLEGLDPFAPVNRQAPAVTKAFHELDKIKAAKDEFPKKVTASNPTPEYAKLHRRERALNEKLFKLSKGQYGHHYKTPYNPGGSGGFFDGARDEESNDFFHRQKDSSSGGGFFSDVR